MPKKSRPAEFVRWFGPLLTALRDLGGSASPREALDRIAELENVPDESPNTLLKSGQERFYKQVHRARQCLVWEGLIESGRRGVWSLTPAGRDRTLTGSNGIERLHMRLLREAGFERVQVTGRSNDGDIDGVGVLQVNDLMSFNVVFQCKKWGQAIPPNEMRDLRGAMDGRADKGIFLTTGTFSTSARAEAERSGTVPIELVDGEKLFEMF